MTIEPSKLLMLIALLAEFASILLELAKHW
jgi:hypothetical protein